MSVRLRGMISRLAAIALIGPLFLVTASKVEAQVTLNLTTAQQTTCTVTTDAQGIRLAPGGTDLIATGVTLSGTGCGGGSGGAPTPNPLTITPSPSSGPVGTTFQLAWTVSSNAASCTGAASLNGSSISVPGWTDVTSTASPRTVTLNSDGTYQFNLTCSNSFGSTSGSTTVSVTTTGGGSCGAGVRQTTATVCYDSNLASCASRDVTKFEGVFGHQTTTDPALVFPGFDGLAVTLKDVVKTSYISAQFTMPTTLPIAEFGKYYKGDTYGANPVTWSISSACGDFTNMLNPTLCMKVGDQQNGLFGVGWKNQGNTGITLCPLVPGQTYYLNMKFTSPPTSSGGTDCSGNTCKMPVQNSVTNP